MFDFEKLQVYQKAKAFHLLVIRWIAAQPGLDRVTQDQLRRASMSIALNIAEGTGRFSAKDRRNFYIIARSSAFEVAAIFDILKADGRVTQTDFERFYLEADEVSRMLFALVKKLDSSAQG